MREPASWLRESVFSLRRTQGILAETRKTRVRRRDDSSTDGSRPARARGRLGAQLAGVVEIRSALSAVAPQIAEIVSYTHADICLHDSPGWVVSYEVGIETRWSRKRTRVQYSPVRELLTGRTDLMLTANAMTDPRYTYPGACCEPILNHRLRSRINVPMVVMGRVIGTLNVSHNIEGLYGMAQVEAVRELSQVLSPHFHALHAAEKAQQAARARARAQEQADGLRRGALELTQALEQERQRIGMDLHDQTLADLTRILRDLTSEAPLDRDVGVSPSRVGSGSAGTSSRSTSIVRARRRERRSMRTASTAPTSTPAETP